MKMALSSMIKLTAAASTVVVAVSASAEAACLTKSQARAKWPKQHLYWYGKNRCWSNVPTKRETRTQPKKQWEIRATSKKDPVWLDLREKKEQPIEVPRQPTFSEKFDSFDPKPIDLPPVTIDDPNETLPPPRKMDDTFVAFRPAIFPSWHVSYAVLKQNVWDVDSFRTRWSIETSYLLAFDITPISDKIEYWKPQEDWEPPQVRVMAYWPQAEPSVERKACNPGWLHSLLLYVKSTRGDRLC